ncbi:MAG: ATP12 family protein, partial [Pseudomonadota bacterium]
MSASGNGTDPQELARKIAAQAVYNRPLAKRFYKKVELVEQANGYGLVLDGRPVKTPLKQALSMPTRSLADEVAEEWEAQEEHINPATMLLTKLCNTALDRVGEGRQRIVDEIVDYANADLLCYRAEGPVELVARQSKQWDPILHWAAEALGARFTPTAGIVHQSQSEDCLGAFRRFVVGLDDF